MPGLTNERTFVGTDIGRWQGSNYTMGAESHLPVVQNMGNPGIGRYDDLVRQNAVGTISTTPITIRGEQLPNGSYENLSAISLVPEEGFNPRQLIVTIVDGAGGATVSVILRGYNGWGGQVEETLACTTVSAAPVFGNTTPADPAPGNYYPYSAAGVAPGYDLIPAANRSNYTYMILKEIVVSSAAPIANCVVSIGRTCVLGLKYPVLGANPFRNGTDEFLGRAPFFLQEMWGTNNQGSTFDMRGASEVQINSAYCRGALRSGLYTGGEPRGVYTPYIPLQDTGQGTVGTIGFMVIYIPSRIDNHSLVQPHMFVESGGGINNYFPNRDMTQP